MSAEEKKPSNVLTIVTTVVFSEGATFRCRNWEDGVLKNIEYNFAYRRKNHARPDMWRGYLCVKS